MSYSPIEERKAEVWTATKEEDAERLYELASQFKEEGDDELADDLQKIARRIERDEWAYDEARDNEL